MRVQRAVADWREKVWPAALYTGHEDSLGQGPDRCLPQLYGRREADSASWGSRLVVHAAECRNLSNASGGIEAWIVSTRRSSTLETQ
ncbi:hypothetical protein NEOLEDRAFT_966125 [Neolentinus lepideus HHB14362 ss-1]|uniref:Uncharacterized protein n=1 Tax=Neolentinus lepideus HHB14362 ss-1 TaxID=1314782 RepID=A0A165NC57_9AGAM|nr:hypothetical protein NEOLEDRAFT_966125 [Neolentinus lepideus HHB14362 ss-1]